MHFTESFKRALPFRRGLPSFAGCLMNPLCEDRGVSFGVYISSSHSGTAPFSSVCIHGALQDVVLYDIGDVV